MKKNSSDTIGHQRHMGEAEARGLPGSMPRRIKLTLLGAGSMFTPRLASDLLQIPGECGGTFALVDIDPSRLRTMHRLIEKLIGARRKKGWTVVSSTDRRKVLKGSDYIVNCIEVSGTACVEFDNDIPLRYGVDQCIGDTIGPGGLFKALRTVPVWIEVLKDCERQCPDALVLNYTNPMAMMCLAAARTSSMRVIGLCHSVQNTSHLLAEYAGVPFAEMTWTCAGINHLAWFTTLKHKGRDLYPTLRNKFAREIDAGFTEHEAGLARADAADNCRGNFAGVRYKQADLVRKDVCMHFGAFVTESSGHLSEYLPYYRKSEDGRKLLRLAYDGGSRFYATNWPRWRKAANAQRNAMLNGGTSTDWERSWEYATWIIEGREKNARLDFHGNVMNQTADGLLISNLPMNGCVEVLCTAGRGGIQPQMFGALPPQLAAVSASNMGVFDLGAQAAIERSIEKAIYALLLDPLTSAVCTPRQIKAMALEMFAAEESFLPRYR